MAGPNRNTLPPPEAAHHKAGGGPHGATLPPVKKPTNVRFPTSKPKKTAPPKPPGAFDNAVTSGLTPTMTAPGSPFAGISKTHAPARNLHQPHLTAKVQLAHLRQVRLDNGGLLTPAELRQEKLAKIVLATPVEQLKVVPPPHELPRTGGPIGPPIEPTPAPLIPMRAPPQEPPKPSPRMFFAPWELAPRYDPNPDFVMTSDKRHMGPPVAEPGTWAEALGGLFHRSDGKAQGPWGGRPSPRTQTQAAQPGQSDLGIGSALGHLGDTIQKSARQSKNSYPQPLRTALADTRDTVSKGAGTAIETAASVGATGFTPIHPGATHTAVQDVKPTYFVPAERDVTKRWANAANKGAERIHTAGEHEASIPVAWLSGRDLPDRPHFPGFHVVDTSLAKQFKGQKTVTESQLREAAALGAGMGGLPAETRTFLINGAVKIGWNRADLIHMTDADLVHAYGNRPAHPILQFLKNAGSFGAVQANIPIFPVAVADATAQAIGGNAKPLEDMGQQAVEGTIRTLPQGLGGDRPLAENLYWHPGETLQNLALAAGLTDRVLGAAPRAVGRNPWPIEPRVIHPDGFKTPIQRGYYANRPIARGIQKVRDKYVDSRNPITNNIPVIGGRARRRNAVTENWMDAGERAKGRTFMHAAELNMHLIHAAQKVGGRRVAELNSLLQGSDPAERAQFYGSISKELGGKAGRGAHAHAKISERLAAGADQLSADDHAYLDAARAAATWATETRIGEGQFTAELAARYRIWQEPIQIAARGGDPVAQQLLAAREVHLSELQGGGGAAKGAKGYRNVEAKLAEVERQIAEHEKALERMGGPPETPLRHSTHGTRAAASAEMRAKAAADPERRYYVKQTTSKANGKAFHVESVTSDGLGPRPTKAEALRKARVAPAPSPFKAPEPLPGEGVPPTDVQTVRQEQPGEQNLSGPEQPKVPEGAEYLGQSPVTKGHYARMPDGTIVRNQTGEGPWRFESTPGGWKGVGESVVFPKGTTADEARRAARHAEDVRTGWDQATLDRQRLESEDWGKRLTADEKHFMQKKGLTRIGTSGNLEALKKQRAAIVAAQDADLWPKASKSVLAKVNAAIRRAEAKNEALPPRQRQPTTAQRDAHEAREVATLGGVRLTYGGSKGNAGRSSAVEVAAQLTEQTGVKHDAERISTGEWAVMRPPGTPEPPPNLTAGHADDPLEDDNFDRPDNPDLKPGTPAEEAARTKATIARLAARVSEARNKLAAGGFKDEDQKALDAALEHQAAGIELTRKPGELRPGDQVTSANIEGRVGTVLEVTPKGVRVRGGQGGEKTVKPEALQLVKPNDAQVQFRAKSIPVPYLKPAETKALAELKLKDKYNEGGMTLHELRVFTLALKKKLEVMTPGPAQTAGLKVWENLQRLHVAAGIEDHRLGPNGPAYDAEMSRQAAASGEKDSAPRPGETKDSAARRAAEPKKPEMDPPITDPNQPGYNIYPGKTADLNPAVGSKPTLAEAEKAAAEYPGGATVGSQGSKANAAPRFRVGDRVTGPVHPGVGTVIEILPGGGVKIRHERGNTSIEQPGKVKLAGDPIAVGDLIAEEGGKRGKVTRVNPDGSFMVQYEGEKRAVRHLADDQQGVVAGEADLPATHQPRTPTRLEKQLADTAEPTKVMRARVKKDRAQSDADIGRYHEGDQVMMRGSAGTVAGKVTKAHPNGDVTVDFGIHGEHPVAPGDLDFNTVKHPDESAAAMRRAPNPITDEAHQAFVDRHIKPKAAEPQAAPSTAARKAPEKVPNVGRKGFQWRGFHEDGTETGLFKTKREAEAAAAQESRPAKTARVIEQAKNAPKVEVSPEQRVRQLLAAESRAKRLGMTDEAKAARAELDTLGSHPPIGSENVPTSKGSRSTPEEVAARQAHRDQLKEDATSQYESDLAAHNRKKAKLTKAAKKKRDQAAVHEARLRKLNKRRDRLQLTADQLAHDRGPAAEDRHGHAVEAYSGGLDTFIEQERERGNTEPVYIPQEDAQPFLPGQRSKKPPVSPTRTKGHLSATLDRRINTGDYRSTAAGIALEVQRAAIVKARHDLHDIVLNEYATKAEPGAAVSEDEVLVRPEALATTKKLEHTIDEHNMTDEQVVSTIDKLLRQLEEHTISERHHLGYVPESGNYMVIPRSIYDELHNSLRIDKGKIMRGYDSFNHAYQRLMLSKPSTGVSNYVGNPLLAMIGGASLMDIKRGYRLANHPEWLPPRLLEGGLAQGLGQRPARTPIGKWINYSLSTQRSAELAARAALYHHFAGPIVAEMEKAGRSAEDTLQRLASGEDPRGADLARKVEHFLSSNRRSKKLSPEVERFMGRSILFHRWLGHILTLTMYTLPVKYPGRAVLLQRMAEIGDDYRKHHGVFPAWYAGMLPLMQFVTGDGDKLTRVIPTSTIWPSANLPLPLADEQGANPEAAFINAVQPVVRGLAEAPTGMDWANLRQFKDDKGNAIGPGLNLDLLAGLEQRAAPYVGYFAPLAGKGDTSHIFNWNDRVVKNKYGHPLPHGYGTSALPLGGSTPNLSRDWLEGFLSRLVVGGSGIQDVQSDTKGTRYQRNTKGLPTARSAHNTLIQDQARARAKKKAAAKRHPAAPKP